MCEGVYVINMATNLCMHLCIYVCMPLCDIKGMITLIWSVCDVYRRVTFCQISLCTSHMTV